MEKVKRKISEKKIMLFILIASIAAVAIYLIFLIPHSTTTEFFQSDSNYNLSAVPRGIYYRICEVVFNNKHPECFNSHKAL